MEDFSKGFGSRATGLFRDKTEPERQYGGPQSGLPPPFLVAQSVAPYLNIGLDYGSYSCRVCTFSQGEVYRLNPYDYSALVQDALSIPTGDSNLVHSIKVQLAAGRKLKVGDNIYSPIDLSAELLRRIKGRIESTTQKMLAKAVISVPASFNHRQRTALIESAEIAGVNVLGLMNDHCAAALDYCFRDEIRNGIFLVVSSGVYSFEIAMVDVQNGLIETKAIKTSMQMSGFAANLAMMDYVKKHREFDDENALHIFVERLKIELSNKAPTLAEKNAPLKPSLGKEALSKHLHQFKKQYQTLFSELVLESNVAISDVQAVIFTGGAASFWILQEAAKATFPNSRLSHATVSSGAAIQAALLVRELKDWVVWDALASPVYVAQGERMKCVISANSPTPLNGHITLEAGEDGKAQASIFQKVMDVGVENDLVCVAKVAAQIPIPVAKNTSESDGASGDITLSVMANADGTLKFSARLRSLDTSLPLAVQDMVGVEGEPGELS